MSSSPDRAELGVRGASVLSGTWTKHINCRCFWDPVHFKSPQTSKIMWQYISFLVTDGLVIIAGVSVAWTILSWSGGHEFNPRPGWTWGVCGTSVISRTWTRHIFVSFCSWKGLLENRNWSNGSKINHKMKTLIVAFISSYSITWTLSWNCISKEISIRIIRTLDPVYFCPKLY